MTGRKPNHTRIFSHSSPDQAASITIDLRLWRQFGPKNSCRILPIVDGSDWDFQVVWQLQNLGAGNAGAVRERLGEQREATVELFRIQDQVAAEVAQANAQLEAAAARIKEAEYGLAAAEVSYDGNLKGLSETIRAGQQLQLVIRPQEVSAALLQLRQAYANYYSSINDYNRAEFRLYHAIGYPAQELTCSTVWGDPQAVECQQPLPAAPVAARTNRAAATR